MYTFGTNTIGFKSVSGATNKDFSFDMSSITANVSGGRVYTLPDASGTIALTSNLSAYLPLAGGTLTGALNGTSASFSSGLIVSNISDVYPEIKTSAAGADAFLGFSNTGDANSAWGIGRRNTGEFWIANYTGNFNSGTRTVPFQIASSGVATFSDSVLATNLFLSGTTPPIVEINNGNSAITSGAVLGTLQFRGSDSNISSSERVGAKIEAVANNDWVATNNSSTNLLFYTHGNGTGTLLERMRITNTGKVGIGTDIPSNQLEVGGEGIIRIRPTTDNTQSALFFNDTTTAGNSYRSDIGILDNGGLYFSTTNTINIAPTERMRITSDGDLTMAQPKSISINLDSTTFGGSAKYWRLNSNAANGTFRLQQITNGGGMYLDPNNPSGGWLGISDMLLKNDLGFIEEGALGKIMNLKPRRFTFKTQDENALPSVGFFAQEIIEYLPETITEIEEEDGEVLTYNANFVIPYLVKAIQEQQEQINSLKNQMK
jgi:hypothetical protein